MESYISNDGTVAKYVHDDGSETAIKTLPPGAESCGGANRNKFNVFASCSVGCPVGCKFCYLHVKKVAYTQLTHLDITNNVIDATLTELIRRPELKKIPMNLSWMGMGDPWLKLGNINIATERIFNRLDVFIEGVDIATTLPGIKHNDLEYIKRIDTYLNPLRVAPKPKERTNIRIFYSLHSLDNKTRKKLIPKTLDLNVALPYLDNVGERYNVIYHCMFLDGINDTDKDIDALSFLGATRNLRILRYNKCAGSAFNESKKFNEIIEKLNSRIDIKVQVSPGSEISAACGMFLAKYKGK